MIIPSTMSEQTIAVLGLGRSGQATCHALVKAGAVVYGHDDAIDLNKIDLPEAVTLAGHDDWPWDELDAMVISPGIPHQFPKPHPAAKKAMEMGIPVISDIELLMRAKPAAKMIGITGTNGKSTVVTLIDHLLSAQGIKTALGGNIGVAALGLTDPGKDGVIILELSSYQLETTPSLALDAGAVINITPDHLDRHGGWDGYVAAKANLVKAVKPEGLLVLGQQGAAAQLAKLATSPVMMADPETAPDRSACPSLSGPHNAVNTAIACHILKFLGMDDAAIENAIADFKGLPHRMETVASIKRINFVNDSKATNGDAAAEALKTYDHIYWIAGGDAKDDGLGIAADHLNHVRHAYMIGSSAEQFAEQVKDRCPVAISHDLETATHSAFHDAQKDGASDGADEITILLSPAAASFDQFQNFEMRGEKFRQIATGLTEASHD